MSLDLKRKIEKQATEIGIKKQKYESLDLKISRLLGAVQEQGLLGNLVVIIHDENQNDNPYVILQNAVAYLNIIVEVIRKEQNSTVFVLIINGDEFVSGDFPNIQTAKRALAVKTLEKLKEICFFITKKKDYVNVTKENLDVSSTSDIKIDPPVNTNSIAHKIMMKMGWTGGGLGSQEQGNLDSVMIYENVNREGFGSKNLMKEITKKMDNFAKQTNLLTLVFNSDFTKEERALIHQVARKFNLKSKSTGSNNDRKLTVSKKNTRMDIVKELLKIGGEDGLYKLHIPCKFTHLWD